MGLRGGRRGRVVAWGAGVAAVAVALAVALVAVRPWQAAEADALSPAVRDELARRTARLLETAPAGRELLTTGYVPVACAVRPLGTDPPAVTRAADARVVYVWALCSTVERGAERSGVSVPLVVTPGPPTRVRKPVDGAGYTASVRDMFPARLHGAALSDLDWTGGLEPALRARILELSR
ncbi:MAG TPA: hypothetical protein VES42_01445 [Pilimelia sp.]|nr:hypothetical protein [Pilimelia sp.]